MNEQRIKQIENAFNFFALSVLGIDPNSDQEELSALIEERGYALGYNKDRTQVFFGRQGEEEPTVFCSLDLEEVANEQRQYSAPYYWAEVFKKDINDCNEADFVADNCLCIVVQDDADTYEVFGKLDGNDEYKAEQYDFDGVAIYAGAIVNSIYAPQPSNTAEIVSVPALLNDLGVQHTDMGYFMIDENIESGNLVVEYFGSLNYEEFINTDKKYMGIVVELPKPRQR